MTIIRVRLCDADRDRYDEPQWMRPVDGLLFDSEVLKDMPAGELYALERETDLAIASVLPLMEPPLSKLAIARRLVAFLAMRQAGSAISWDNFQPQLLRTEFVEVADSNPPAGPSERSSEAAPQLSSSAT